jgi:hypothetical protein
MRRVDYQRFNSPAHARLCKVRRLLHWLRHVDLRKKSKKSRLARYKSTAHVAYLLEGDAATLDSVGLGSVGSKRLHSVRCCDPPKHTNNACSVGVLRWRMWGNDREKDYLGKLLDVGNGER